MTNEKKILTAQTAEVIGSPDFTEQIAQLVKSDLSPKMLHEKLLGFHNSDIAETAETLEAPERIKLFRILDTAELADVFEYIPSEKAAEYLGETDIRKMVALIGNMESDAAADILRELSKERRTQVIALPDGDFRKKMELIASFDEDETGSCMSTNFIVINSEMTAAEAM